MVPEFYTSRQSQTNRQTQSALVHFSKPGKLNNPRCETPSEQPPEELSKKLKKKKAHMYVGTSHNVRPNQMCKIKDKKGQKHPQLKPHLFKSAADNILRPAHWINGKRMFWF